MTYENSNQTEKQFENGDLKRRKRLLTVIIPVSVFAAVVGLVRDFSTADYLGIFFEIASIVVFAVSFVLIKQDKYSYSSFASVCAFIILAMGLSFDTSNLSIVSLYKNIVFFMLATTFAVVLRIRKRFTIVIFAIAVIVQLIVTFYFLAPVVTEKTELFTTLVLSIFLLMLETFVLVNELLCLELNEQDLKQAHNESVNQVSQMTNILTSGKATLNSLEQMNEHIGQIKILLDSSSNTIGEMTKEVSIMNKNGEETNSATDIIGNRIDLLNLLIQGYIAALKESSESINQMVASIKTVASSANYANNAMSSLSQTSLEGIKQLDSLLASIAQIEGGIGSVQNIVGVINDIAEHTNLLSMNAAIEAAHAGNSGKGFAVVAEEIRKLADNSSKHANDINAHLSAVVNQISEAVNGSTLTKNSFTQIQEKITESTQSFEEIARATSELSNGGQSILKSMQDLDSMSGQIKDGGKDITKAQTELKKTTKDLILSLENLTSQSRIVFEKNSQVNDAVVPIEKIAKEGLDYAKTLRF